MTYDLVQNGDNQLNTEIKEALINRGWSDCALYRVKPSNRVMEDFYAKYNFMETR